MISLLVMLAAATPEASCLADYDRAAAAIEKLAPAARVRPLLRAIRACPLLSTPLRDALDGAFRAGARTERILILGTAAQKINGPICRPHTSTAAASLMAHECPLHESMELTESMLADLDQGTYAFAVALVREMERAQVFVYGGKLLVSSLLLAAASEGRNVSGSTGTPRRRTSK